MKKISFAFTLAGALFLLLSCGGKKTGQTIKTEGNNINPDSVEFSFVFVGCNRVDEKDSINSNTNLSTANLPELQRTFEEVCKLKPTPKYFFFLGDLVLGLDANPKELETELSAWVKQYNDNSFSPIAKSGIQMIAVPGNHEMLYYGDSGEVPWQGALPVWMKTMKDFMPDEPLNRVGGPDSLNNLATFSFTHKNTHFILLNTDTYNPALKPGEAPATWINNDIAAARQNPAVQHVFLLGHKPSYLGDLNPAYDDSMDGAVTSQIWPVMQTNKVEAMLSAHSHQYKRMQPTPGGSYQVIAGNGGSPYVKHLSKNDQFFGYSVIYVMKNGQVMLQSMGRSIPDKSYLETIPKGDKDSERDKADISWGTNAPAWVSETK